MPDVRYEMLMMIEVVITKSTLPGGFLRLNRPVGWPAGRTTRHPHGSAGTKVTNRDRFCGERSCLVRCHPMG